MMDKSLPIFSIVSTNDYTKEGASYSIFLDDLPWPCEDGIADDFSHEDIYPLCKIFLMLQFCDKINIRSDFQGMHISEDMWNAKKTINADIISNIPFGSSNKTISGGRQGCAYFLKLCGPLEMREISIARLSSIVQKLIDDDFIR